MVDCKPHIQWQMLWPLVYVGRGCANGMYSRCYVKMWQMEYHCGRCHGHKLCKTKCGRWNKLWWMLWPLGCIDRCCVLSIWLCYARCGRCNCHCYKDVYFNLSSGCQAEASFHLCGRWYLPMFLLRDGLLKPYVY